MCFSPEADLVGAVAVGVVGIDTLRQVREPRDAPLACVPLVFAAHFLIETFVWWGLRGEVPWSVGHDAAWLYLFIALVVVPSFVPLAVTLAEPSGSRRRLMIGFTVLGTAVAAFILRALADGTFSARVQDHCIRYDTHVPNGGRLTALYVVATCGVLLLSSSRRIFTFGWVNLIVVVLLAWLMTHAFISLWCAWAAITSVVIDLHLRSEHRPADPRRGTTDRRGVDAHAAGYSP